MIFNPTHLVSYWRAFAFIRGRKPRSSDVRSLAVSSSRMPKVWSSLQICRSSGARGYSDNVVGAPWTGWMLQRAASDARHLVRHNKSSRAATTEFSRAIHRTENPTKRKPVAERRLTAAGASIFESTGPFTHRASRTSLHFTVIWSLILSNSPCLIPLTFMTSSIVWNFPCSFR